MPKIKQLSCGRFWTICIADEPGPGMMHELISQLLARVEDLGMYRERAQVAESQIEALREEVMRLESALEMNQELERALARESHPGED